MFYVLGMLLFQNFYFFFKFSFLLLSSFIKFLFKFDDSLFEFFFLIQFLFLLVLNELLLFFKREHHSCKSFVLKMLKLVFRCFVYLLRKMFQIDIFLRGLVLLLLLGHLSRRSVKMLTSL